MNLFQKYQKLTIFTRFYSSTLEYFYQNKPQFSGQKHYRIELKFQL